MSVNAASCAHAETGPTPWAPIGFDKQIYLVATIRHSVEHMIAF